MIVQNPPFRTRIIGNSVLWARTKPVHEVVKSKSGWIIGVDHNCRKE